MTTQLFSMRFVIFWLLAGILTPVILLINPIKEMAVDDDWGYALTVKHLMDTGSYKSIEWASPSMQFSGILGCIVLSPAGIILYSLRISTLELTFLGLIAFYYLAQEHRLDRS